MINFILYLKIVIALSILFIALFLIGCKGEIYKDEIIEMEMLNARQVFRSSSQLVTFGNEKEITPEIVLTEKDYNSMISIIVVKGKSKAFFKIRKTTYVNRAEGVPFYTTEYSYLNILNR